jgi:hypothetical protein
MDMTPVSSARTGPAHAITHTASKAIIPTRINNFIFIPPKKVLILFEPPQRSEHNISEDGKTAFVLVSITDSRSGKMPRHEQAQTRRNKKPPLKE